MKKKKRREEEEIGEFEWKKIGKSKKSGIF